MFSPSSLMALPEPNPLSITNDEGAIFEESFFFASSTLSKKGSM
jgi:hypothetical protein